MTSENGANTELTESTFYARLTLISWASSGPSEDKHMFTRAVVLMTTLTCTQVCFFQVALPLLEILLVANTSHSLQVLLAVVLLLTGSLTSQAFWLSSNPGRVWVGLEPFGGKHPFARKMIIKPLHEMTPEDKTVHPGLSKVYIFRTSPASAVLTRLGYIFSRVLLTVLMTDLINSCHVLCSTRHNPDFSNT